MRHRMSHAGAARARAGRSVASGVVAAVIDAEGVVKRFGATTALDGATLQHRARRHRAGRRQRRRQDDAARDSCSASPGPTRARSRSSASTPSTPGPTCGPWSATPPSTTTCPATCAPSTSSPTSPRSTACPTATPSARASDALWQVGLGEERFRALGTMSTGQRQRVKLAAALAHDPHLLLLDEPTDGLDPVQRDDMLALIRRIGTEYGIDVVLSSHLLDEVERVCDGAVILGEGRVLAPGPARLRCGPRVGGWEVEVEAQHGGRSRPRSGRRRRPCGPRASACASRASTTADAIRDAVAAARARPRAAAAPPPLAGGRVPRGRRVRQPERRQPMSDARIFDRGYRPYDGPRLGPRRRGAEPREGHRAAGHGHKRPARAKVLPVAARSSPTCPPSCSSAWPPSSTTRRTRRNVIPTYGEYYGFIISALIVFAAFVAPEALCPDRRTGMLGLYLASPLTRDRYLAAKVAAVAGAAGGGHARAAAAHAGGVRAPGPRPRRSRRGC